MESYNVKHYPFNEKDSASNSYIKHNIITALTSCMTQTFVCYYVRDVMLTVPDKTEFNLSVNLRVSSRSVNGIINNRSYSKLSNDGWH